MNLELLFWLFLELGLFYYNRVCQDFSLQTEWSYESMVLLYEIFFRKFMQVHVGQIKY